MVSQMKISRIKASLWLWLALAFDASAQSGTVLIDPRDDTNYTLTEIRGTIWMKENLNLTTDLSMVLGPEVYDDSIAVGRYYHVHELDSICPPGWKLPNMEQWLDYFDFLDEIHPEVTLAYEDKLKKDDLYRIIEYEGIMSPFEENNPLNIKQTGWIQGGQYSSDVPHLLATYWIQNITDDKLNRSHIHITPMWTHIHSHKHNVKPKDEESLRRFMVRCVKR